MAWYNESKRHYLAQKGIKTSITDTADDRGLDYKTYIHEEIVPKKSFQDMLDEYDRDAETMHPKDLDEKWINREENKGEQIDFTVLGSLTPAEYDMMMNEMIDKPIDEQEEITEKWRQWKEKRKGLKVDYLISDIRLEGYPYKPYFITRGNRPPEFFRWVDESEYGVAMNNIGGHFVEITYSDMGKIKNDVIFEELPYHVTYDEYNKEFSPYKRKPASMDMKRKFESHKQMRFAEIEERKRLYDEKMKEEKKR